MAKRKVLMTGATGYIASQRLPCSRDIYDMTLLDVKDSDPSGAKLPGTVIADRRDPNLNRYRHRLIS